MAEARGAAATGAALGRAARGVACAYGALVFAPAPLPGALMAAATFVRPTSGLAGLTAVGAAHATAAALGYRVDAIRGGYYGYSALLVGLAVAAGHALDPRLVALVALAGVAAALVTAVVGDLLQRGAGLPVLALPFVLVAAMLAPTFSALPAAGDGLLDRTLIEPALPLPDLLALGVRSLGAIVFAPHLVAGALVLAALLVSSRVATALAAVGIAGALATGAILDAPAHEALAMTYNGCLTAIAIGAIFFVPGRAALFAAALAAVLAGWVTLGVAALGARIGLGVLAWPFVLVTLVTVRALHLRAPDRPPFPTPLPALSPEANLEFAAARAARFGIPGPPQLALPFFGAWTVTQGVDGAHTHQGAWAQALDFEILDDAGFPFRGDGARLEDYHAWGLPVLAPVTGTVAAIHDGMIDSTPGETETARPWGNAIILHAGGDLYAVVAHLKQGSIQVVVGQPVVAGQPIAACGASGRSPRPHLHLQVQRSAELGAPAIPFRLIDYVVEGAPRSYVHVGLPAEGERIARPTRSPVVDAFAALPPGAELTLVSEDRTSTSEPRTTVRLRSEVSLLGDRYLLDLDRGDRLYFTVIHGNLTFTSHTGGPGAPLRALFRAMPRLPSVAGGVRFADRPPAAALLSRSARVLHDVVRVVGEPLETRAQVDVAEQGGAIVVTTESGVGPRGRARPRFRGRVELDPSGLRALELIDQRRDGAVILRARRAA